MTIKEEVLKEMGLDYKSHRIAIDLTLEKVEELIDNTECSAQDNAIWFKQELKQKLKGGQDGK